MPGCAGPHGGQPVRRQSIYGHEFIFKFSTLKWGMYYV
nr:MAG TPA: hypothetical protein [Bacteriophage sp.]